jgi:hypothetical protein
MFENMNKQSRNLLILLMTLLLNISCEKQVCLYCNTYDLYGFSDNLLKYGNDYLNTYNDSLFICQTDDAWGNIAWGTYNNTNYAEFAFIDLDIYTLGYRTIDNNDIDNDGIINQLDNDIDGDGINNNLDTSPYGIIDTSISELLICTE